MVTSRLQADTSLSSIVDFASALVRTPSQGGIDPYEPVLRLIGDWLDRNDVRSEWVRDPKTDRLVGVTASVTGETPGPRWVLDACADTASVGDLDAWNFPPFSG